MDLGVTCIPNRIDKNRIRFIIKKRNRFLLSTILYNYARAEERFSHYFITTPFKKKKYIKYIIIGNDNNMLIYDIFFNLISLNIINIEIKTPIIVKGKIIQLIVLFRGLYGYIID